MRRAAKILRFRMRTLLLLPVILAAFFAGWSANQRDLQRLAEEAKADAKRYTDALVEARRVRHGRAQRNGTVLEGMMIDALEHQQRIEQRLRQSLRAP